jgi:hypothetical protein
LNLGLKANNASRVASAVVVKSGEPARDRARI